MIPKPQRQAPTCEEGSGYGVLRNMGKHVSSNIWKIPIVQYSSYCAPLGSRDTYDKVLVSPSQLEAKLLRMNG